MKAKISVWKNVSLALSFVLAAAFVILRMSAPVEASEYTNPDTGYSVYFDDQAGLLSSSEKSLLIADMEPITEYGDVIFCTISVNSYSTSYFAETYFHQTLGMGVEDGVLFLIDMDNRNLYIFSDGTLYQKLGTTYADSITDNVYRKATAGEYYECASKAYSQIYTVLNGHMISQPMKYICNAMVALLAAMIICFIIVSVASKLKNPTDAELLNIARMRFQMSDLTEEKGHTTKTYSPQSSGSGGGGGHSGGGGGGGHSGGGGGHGF